MGSWRVDQHKIVRRRIWGQTRGQSDDVWQDFAQRIKPYPHLSHLRFEKIGTEIHCWRQLEEPGDSPYWTSCLRFVDDGWGYWSVHYRTDEGRWRTAEIKEQPIGRAIAAAADWYKLKFKD